MFNNSLCTVAWLLIGLTDNVPGILELANGKLAFTTEEGSVFSVPLSEVRDINFPWHYFGGASNSASDLFVTDCLSFDLMMPVTFLSISYAERNLAAPPRS